MKKDWWKSKTIWVNVAVGALAAIQAGTDVLGKAAPLELVGFLAAANVALRFLTGEPVVTKKPK